MATRFPPRYLPTLTEVVLPKVRDALAVSTADAAAPFVNEMPMHADGVPIAPPTLDRDALVRSVIQQVRPQLEAELRQIAQDLFEAQYSALLPSLHLQIEEAVREAINQALPEVLDTN